MVLLWSMLASAVAVGAQETPPSEALGVSALREERYGDALRIFDALAAAEPESAQAHYGRGLALSGLFDYAAAASAFERSVALEPSLAAAHRQLVIHYSQLGKRESAHRAFVQARKLAPVPAPEAVPMARALRKAGLLDDARVLLEKGPAGAAGRLELGLLEVEDGNDRRAVEHLEVAAAQLGTPGAMYEFARTLERLDRSGEAIEVYRSLLEKQPAHRQARFRLGTLLLRSGEEDEGSRLLEGYEQFRQWDREVKLLMAMVSSGTLDPEQKKQRTLRLIRLLLSGNALERAERMIESGLAAYPDEPAFRVARARWLMAAGDLEACRLVVDELLPLSPPPPDAVWMSAQLYMRGGQIERAVSEYERLLALWPKPPPPAKIHQELATAYAMASRFEESIRQFERAMASDPSSASAQADFGLVLETVGRVEDAEARYRRALALDPRMVAAQQGLASLLLERGSLDEAVELFQRSVDAHPADPVLRRNLALALDRAGKTDAAAAELRKARELESPP